MDPLSSHPQITTRLILLALVTLLLGPACLSSIALTDSPSARPAEQVTFQSYGFSVSGFTGPQEEIIRQTLAAFAEALGSREQLRKIITAYNNGKNWKITFDPNFTGADSSMKLGPIVFSLEKATAANYSSYCAGDDETYARVVIGHEIGHLLVRATKASTGADWSKSYEKRVNRDWHSLNSSRASEEEAVTELSLKVLGLGYVFPRNVRQAETQPEIIAQIDGWAEDFLQSNK
jgi:hypothetical protein